MVYLIWEQWQHEKGKIVLKVLSSVVVFSFANIKREDKEDKSTSNEQWIFTAGENTIQNTFLKLSKWKAPTKPCVF